VTRTYHVVPHTHWDREWYLPFDAFRVRLVHLLDELRALLHARPDYRAFLLDGQTVVLDDYLEVRPEARAELEALGRAGRFEVGPWYVLPDTFLVSGESLVRNLLRGLADAEPFGGAPRVGYVPDSFGHTAQLPQLFRQLGFEAAVVWRGFGGEPGQEGDAYRWRAPDGSTVAMTHLPDVGYSAAYFDDPSPEAVRERWAGVRQRQDGRARTSETLVLSGGDHHFPVAHFPEALAHLDGEGGRVVHSTLGDFAEAFVRAAEGAELPEATGEFRFGYRWAFNVSGGVYSSRMPLKVTNARAQRRMERVLEPLDALAVQADGPSQRALLRTGWTYLLQNHPHDTVCGCSVDAVHREQATRYEKLAALADGVEAFAWRTLAPGPEGMAGDTRSVTVFNPSPFARDAVATFAVDFYVQQIVVGLNPDVVPDPPLDPPAGFALRDAAGRDVPFEVVAQGEAPGFALSRYSYPAQSRVMRYTVRADLRALPPMGLRTLAVVRTDTFAPVPDAGLRAGERWIENAHLHVEARGGAFYVTERATGRTFGPLGHLEDGADAGDLYNYSPPAHDEVLVSTQALDLTVEAQATGLAASLRIAGTWFLPEGLSGDRRSRRLVPTPFAVTAHLGPHDRAVRFETTFDNRTRDHRLRVRVETGRQTNTHHAESAFAVVTREQQAYDVSGFSIEVPAAVAPMQRFVTVEDAEAGATLLSDGLPEYELVHNSGGRLCLTLLRCVGELARDGLMMRPGGRSGWVFETPEAQSPGTHTFRWAFLPHGPGWTDHLGAIHLAAEAFLLPPVVHAGLGDAASSPPPPRGGGRGEESVVPESTVIRWSHLSPAPSSSEEGEKTDPAGDRPALALDPPALSLSAFKAADDGDGLVVRVYNPTPMPITGTLRFFDAPVRICRAGLDEGPGEVLTLDGEGVLRDTWPPFRLHTYRAAWPEGR
jgi:mannosylglycerate hydrolase